MLTVDLANAVFVDVVAEWARKHSTLTFTEVFLDRDHLPVTGPEGRYLHEIVVPTQGAGLLPSQSAVIPHPADVRLCGRHAPGSEWLYVKLYAGPAGVETLLREVARPVIADALRALAVDRWFFVRYGDPDWHIRLRMHGDPERLLAEVLPALTARCGRYLRSGLIWRIQVDTYEPEVERYGGLAGMRLAEAVFCADSEAVLRTIEFDCGEDVPARWRSALVGVDRLLCDLGLDHQDRHDIVTDAVTRFEQQLRVDTQLRRQLGARYRRERTGLEHLLRAPGSCAAFSQRTAALSTVRDQLHEVVPPQHLSRWVGSLTHMHLNRMLRTPTSQQEFVIYDLLHRHYKSLRARVQRRI
jgi:thiopeptide-type bacteriocin biosynthesis protein